MGAVDLHYEPRTDARPVVIEGTGGVTRIIVAMPGPYAPVPKWVGNLDVLALFVAAVWWVSVLLVRTCFRIPKPPRAVVEISNDRFMVSFCDPRSGEIAAFDWPRSAVVEARANRYEKGLWLNVPGHVKDTFLADLPRESLDRLDEALRCALAGQHAPPGAAC